ncbi:phenylalanyl-tRNA synthetase beta subunit [Desulfuromusa kysingii]|uniref:Phenylalanine--tRNA ligase beta subunit n=1 Tax=Desulfuromusa kysingii TaxID=37625 RepID=A0A1H4D4Q4_9BACT|nr:phenylalanine--tRNA ligase subunit beta [Desulfuromusa kysingii]SEA67480.1 phenylalanyl-tRNA synthetase beta subunit [Desulfuromusa kysingii]
MIVTYNWLKEFVDFQDSPQQLCDRLTMVGLEVEALEEIGGNLDSVIVAKLESVEPHPDADRLTVCQVNTGQEVVQVVCGATNHKTGDLIALAQPGSVLPGDFKIKKSKIRGQVSQGMLCSEKELGMAAESPGIMILAPELTLGEPVFSALGLKDYQIEIGLTPNRPDCLSVVGIAREVAALSQQKLKLPSSEIEEGNGQIQDQATVIVENSEGCPRYAARMIKDIKIGPSPDWMVRRLQAVGMRSINNVVDVTNYVMMELGHPLHAFDFRYLDGGKIIVKNAQQGDKFITLDENEHTLSAEDLMICDGQRPVAMAGIMGGLNSEVKDDTNTVLLEAAYFKPTMIRRSSKRNGLHTESSHRFERGADIDMIPVVLDRAASLIAELADGQVVSGVIDCYPQPLKPIEIELSADKTRNLLDIDIDRNEIQRLLESIGLKAGAGSCSDCLQVKVPSFRPDIEREVDLIEEIARLYGYDQIPVTMPVGAVDAKLPSLRQLLQKTLRQSMVAAGFSEAINYSFVATDSISKIGISDQDSRSTQVKILNPLSEDQAVMRTSLVPSLLETVAKNLNYRSSDLRLFELRPVFLTQSSDQSVEKLSLTAVMSGQREPEGWSQNSQAVDFYDIKGVVEAVLSNAHIENVAFDPLVSQPYLHPGKSCQLRLGDQSLGFVGEVHPEILHKFGIEQPVYLFELDVETAISVAGQHAQFKPLSKFPDVKRDSALLLDESISAEQVMDVINQSKVRFVESASIFDLYTGKGVPAGKKSLAIRVCYRDLEKTLTESEVTKSHDKLIRSLCHRLEAEIR